jgi:hypothetical protein
MKRVSVESAARQKDFCVYIKFEFINRSASVGKKMEASGTASARDDVV